MCQQLPPAMSLTQPHPHLFVYSVAVGYGSEHQKTSTSGVCLGMSLPWYNLMVQKPNGVVSKEPMKLLDS